MARKKEPSKEIAYQDNTIATENDLPLPIAYYPGHYGAFFAFSEKEEKELFFCSCAKEAISNYIRFRIESDRVMCSAFQNNYILSKGDFPQKIVEQLIQKDKDPESRILSLLNFKNGICHECNKVTPSYRYCHQMYGGVFVQNYGWYINKQSYEYGVKPVSFLILDDVCPSEVFSLLDDEDKNFLSKYDWLSETDRIMAQANDSYFQKCTRRIKNIIENEVRVKFGFKKIGDAWASEMEPGV